MVLNCGIGEDSLKSLDCKEIKSVNPKGNQSWIFIGRIDVEAETPILWPADTKNWLIWKYPDPGKDWRLEEKGTTEDEMVGWHRWLNGHEFEQALGAGDGQGSLVCCSPWDHKESDRNEWLKWTELNWNNSWMLMVVMMTWSQWEHWYHNLQGNCRWMLIDFHELYQLIFSGFQNHYRWWLQPWNWKTLTPWKESYDQPR